MGELVFRHDAGRPVDEGRDLPPLRRTAPQAVRIVQELRITILAVRGDDEDLRCEFQEVAPRHHQHLVRPPELGGGDSVPEAYTLEGVGGQDLVIPYPPPRGSRRMNCGASSMFVDGGRKRICRLVDDDGNGRGQ